MPLRLAGQAVRQGLDVYLFLIGMMLISELARQHGLFDWVSAAAVNHSRGSSVRLFTLVYLLGVGVTVFMSNDATAVVLTPAILPAIRKAKVDPMPCLFACVLIANAASFVLPISNPANLVVFHSGMPPLGRWLSWLGLPSIVSIASTYAVLRIYFRKTLSQPAHPSVPPQPLAAPARMVLAGLVAMTIALLVASALKWELGAPTCLSALLVVGLVSWRYRANPLRLAREISWLTLLLVAGLFVMVNAVEQAGALAVAVRWLGRLESISPPLGAAGAGFAVGVANNIVNNLPLGLLVAGTLPVVHAGPLLTNILLIGIDLGPNLSITGSLATMLWLIALRREKIEVSFWRFLQVGAIAMPVALALTIGAVLAAQKLLHLS
jgi:arsenical pump membrane protein